jgi:hypothetical protein
MCSYLDHRMIAWLSFSLPRLQGHFRQLMSFVILWGLFWPTLLQSEKCWQVIGSLGISNLKLYGDFGISHPSFSRVIDVHNNYARRTSINCVCPKQIHCKGCMVSPLNLGHTFCNHPGSIRKISELRWYSLSPRTP